MNTFRKSDIQKMTEHERRCYELAEFELQTMTINEVLSLALSALFYAQRAKSEEIIKQTYKRVFGSEGNVH